MNTYSLFPLLHLSQTGLRFCLSIWNTGYDFCSFIGLLWFLVKRKAVKVLDGTSSTEACFHGWSCKPQVSLQSSAPPLRLCRCFVSLCRCCGRSERAVVLSLWRLYSINVLLLPVCFIDNDLRKQLCGELDFCLSSCKIKRRSLSAQNSETVPRFHLPSSPVS